MTKDELGGAQVVSSQTGKEGVCKVQFNDLVTNLQLEADGNNCNKTTNGDESVCAHRGTELPYLS